MAVDPKDIEWDRQRSRDLAIHFLKPVFTYSPAIYIVEDRTIGVTPGYTAIRLYGLRLEWSGRNTIPYKEAHKLNLRLELCELTSFVTRLLDQIEDPPAWGQGDRGKGCHIILTEDWDGMTNLLAGLTRVLGTEPIIAKRL